MPSAPGITMSRTTQAGCQLATLALNSSGSAVAKTSKPRPVATRETKAIISTSSSITSRRFAIAAPFACISVSAIVEHLADAPGEVVPAIGLRDEADRGAEDALGDAASLGETRCQENLQTRP